MRAAGKATVQLLSTVPKPGEALVSGVVAQTFTDVDLRTVPALTLWRSVSDADRCHQRPDPRHPYHEAPDVIAQGCIGTVDRTVACHNVCEARHH